jgi:hypothetical protein
MKRSAFTFSIAFLCVAQLHAAVTDAGITASVPSPISLNDAASGASHMTFLPLAAVLFAAALAELFRRRTNRSV